MALLTTASDKNRQITSQLSVNYTTRRIKGTWTAITANITETKTEAWEYSRTATASYSYVGLTEDAAKGIASNLRALYSRSFKVSEFCADDSSVYFRLFQDRDAGTQLMAQIVAQYDSGNMWSVRVDVNEMDTRLRFEAVSPVSLFSVENTRDYDGLTL